MSNGNPDSRHIEPVGDGQTILIIDDDEMLRLRLARAMESRGFRVFMAADFNEAVTVLENVKPDFAVLDLNMPGRSGMEVLEQLVQLSPQTRTVVVTGYGSITTAVEAVRLGAFNYLTKPTDAEEILGALSGSSFEHHSHDKPVYKPQTLAESEWEHIHRVLTDCGDNISEAARQLGIPRRTLQRKLKKRAP